MRAAREHRLPLSVRGGGHDWAGRALREAGLVVDLSAMRRVAVDPAAGTATAQGGATAGDVVAAAGRQVTASSTGDADVYWALRGGGGTFGVVTAARYRLHPVPSVLAGLMLFPLPRHLPCCADTPRSPPRHPTSSPS